MTLTYRAKHLAQKALLTFLGPAQLDEHSDPIRRLDRKLEERFGPRPQTVHRIHIPKRHFSQTPQNV